VPVIHPRVVKTLGVRVFRNNLQVEPEIRLRTPPGWKVTELEGLFGQKRFLVEAPEVENINELNIEFENRIASFVILGPGEARWYPSGQNVPMCPVCHGYKGYCICGKD